MGKKRLRCNHPKETFDLCSSCITSHFKEESVTWTSRNQEIDRFIKYTQIMSRNPETAAYWMKWEELTNIKMIGKGGLGKVYSAQLTRRISDEIPDEIVALKTVGKPNEFSNILAEATALFHSYNKETSSFRILGFTQDPTNEQYYIIITYAESGNLHKYMRDNVKTLSWIDILFIIWDICLDLERIHKAGLIHRNIHSGNVLLTREVCHYLHDVPIHIGVAYIADLGLSMASSNISRNKSEIYGVLPYIAPEVLRGGSYSTKSDVYSIGIIMWELTSGRQPFESVPHDMKLATDICNGLRPQTIPNTLPFYLELMQNCWSDDPLKRPTAKEIKDLVGKWCWQRKIQQMNDADEMQTFSRTLLDDEIKNIQAIYTSRALPLVMTKN